MSEPARPWWQTGVIYQIYPRSFRDSNGSGVGDLAGITSKLDYVARLGVDAVWISPFYPSPMADFGYDVADYTDVDPMFGSIDDFDRLVVRAHQLGLRVIIDWVPNHTSDRHRWFVESARSRSSPKRNWYVWRDAAPGGGEPNNWLSVFGGPAWEWDPTTEQYYLHSFLRQQPDLNWRNPEVEHAMAATLRFWLDRGVDGFRIDVAHFIMKDPAMRDNPPASGSGGHRDWGPYGDQDHLHDKGHPDVHAVFRRLRRLVDSYPGGRVTVGEIHVFDWPLWASYYGATLDELHMPFNFGLVDLPWDAAEFGAVITSVEASLPQGAWPNYVLGNHDEPRLASRFGSRQARLAAMLLLTLRGTPTLYYGDEIGMREGPDRGLDPWGRRWGGRSRDGCRTPMQWDDGPHGGFSDAASAAPWLALNGDCEARNVAAQERDPRSLLHLYRRLLALRRSRPALQSGDMEMLACDGGVLVYRRKMAGAAAVTTVLNFTDEERELTIDAGVYRLSTDMDRRGPAGSAVVLRPVEGILVESGI